MRCDRCNGEGSYWRVPDGFNPFRAGGWATVRASYRVSCWKCGGGGTALPNKMADDLLRPSQYPWLAIPADNPDKT